MGRWWLLIVMLAALVAACGDRSGRVDPAEDVVTDSGTDTGTDTGVDTTTPVPAGPSRVGLVSGAGQRESANYKLNITVGSPVTSHRLQSSQYKMTLGVGATP